MNLAEAPIRAVIFDVDGTLLTTGGAGGVAWDKAFQEVFGKSIDIAAVTESGMTDHDVAFAALRSGIGLLHFDLLGRLLLFDLGRRRFLLDLLAPGRLLLVFRRRLLVVGFRFRLLDVVSRELRGGACGRFVLRRLGRGRGYSRCLDGRDRRLRDGFRGG